MTVKELINVLQQMPQDHRVVVDLHSEYAEARAPRLIEGIENGGYISRVYPPFDPKFVRGYVYIPVYDEVGR